MRFFDFEKAGRNKYIVTDIYDQPLKVEDKRKLGNNSIYSTYISLILMHHLAKKGTHSEVLTKRGLWVLLGMANKKYGKISKDDLRKIDNSITPFEINQFYIRSNKKLDKILLAALGNLRNRRLIDWENQTVIKGEKNHQEHWFVANVDEKAKILEAEYEILRKMKCNTMFQMISKGIQDEFYESVYNLISKYGWNHYYKRIKIIFNANNIQESIPEVEVNLNKQLLNLEVINYLNNEAVKIYDANIEDYNNTLDTAVKTNMNIQWAINRFKLPDNYVMAQKLLADELISINDSDNKQSVFQQMVDLAIASDDVDELFPV